MLRKFWKNSQPEERVFFVVAGLLIAFLGGWLWQEQRTAETLPPLFEDAPASSVDAGKTPPQARLIQVHVAGAVKKSGLLSLPPNKRILDAIRAAGGASTNAAVDALNLAAPLEDGQKIVVPTRAEFRALREAEREAAQHDASDSRPAQRGTSARGTSAKAPPARPINVNTASAEELEQLPGIGPALSARIVAYRRQKGRLQSLDDLGQVKGLGTKKLEKLRQWVQF